MLDKPQANNDASVENQQSEAPDLTKTTNTAESNKLYLGLQGDKGSSHPSLRSAGGEDAVIVDKDGKPVPPLAGNTAGAARNREPISPDRSTTEQVNSELSPAAKRSPTITGGSAFQLEGNSNLPDKGKESNPKTDLTQLAGSNSAIKEQADRNLQAAIDGEHAEGQEEEHSDSQDDQDSKPSGRQKDKHSEEQNGDIPEEQDDKHSEGQDGDILKNAPGVADVTNNETQLNAHKAEALTTNRTQLEAHPVENTAAQTTQREARSVEGTATVTTQREARSVEGTATGTTQREARSVENTAAGTTQREARSVENTATGTTQREARSVENTATGTTQREAHSVENTATGTTQREAHSVENTATGTTQREAQDEAKEAINDGLKQKDEVRRNHLATLDAGRSTDSESQATLNAAKNTTYQAGITNEISELTLADAIDTRNAAQKDGITAETDGPDGKTTTNADGSTVTVNQITGVTIVRNSDNSSTTYDKDGKVTNTKNPDGSSVKDIGNNQIIENKGINSGVVVLDNSSTQVYNQNGSSQLQDSIGTHSYNIDGSAVHKIDSGKTVVADNGDNTSVVSTAGSDGKPIVTTQTRDFHITERDRHTIIANSRNKSVAVLGENNRLEQVNTAAGGTVKYSIDGKPLETTNAKSDGGGVVHYNTKGLLESVDTARGGQVHYDQDGHVSNIRNSTADGGGKVNYSNGGMLESTETASGGKLNYSKDGQLRSTSNALADGGGTVHYGESGQVQSTITEAGGEVTYGKDGQVQTTTNSELDGGGTVHYGESGQVQSTITEAGGEVTYGKDGQVQTTTNSELDGGGTVNYGESGQVQSTITEAGGEVTYGKDGQVQTTTNSELDGGGTVNYGESGQVQSTITEDGGEVTYSKDGQVQTATNSAANGGGTVNYAENGQVQSTTTASGDVVSYANDAQTQVAPSSAVYGGGIANNGENALLQSAPKADADNSTYDKDSQYLINTTSTLNGNSKVNYGSNGQVANTATAANNGELLDNRKIPGGNPFGTASDGGSGLISSNDKQAQIAATVLSHEPKSNNDNERSSSSNAASEMGQVLRPKVEVQSKNAEALAADTTAGGNAGGSTLDRLSSAEKSHTGHPVDLVTAEKNAATAFTAITADGANRIPTVSLVSDGKGNSVSSLSVAPTETLPVNLSVANLSTANLPTANLPPATLPPGDTHGSTTMPGNSGKPNTEAAESALVAEAAKVASVKTSDEPPSVAKPNDVTKTVEKTSTTSEKSLEDGQHRIQVGNASSSAEPALSVAAMPASAIIAHLPSYSKGVSSAMDAQAGIVQQKNNLNKQPSSLARLAPTSVEAKDSNTCVIRNINGEHQYVPVTEAKNLAVGETSFTGHFTTTFDAQGTASITPQGMLKIKPLTEEDIAAIGRKAAGAGAADGAISVGASNLSGEAGDAFSLSQLGSSSRISDLGPLLSESTVSSENDSLTQTESAHSSATSMDSSRQIGNDALAGLETLSQSATSSDPAARNLSDYTNSRIESATTQEANEAGSTLTNLAADGKTPISQTTFDINGNPTSETDFKADGKTPDTVTAFRSDGSVQSLTNYGDDGKVAVATQFAADGFTPTSLTYYGAEGKTPTDTSTLNQDGSVSSSTSSKSQEETREQTGAPKSEKRQRKMKGRRGALDRQAIADSDKIAFSSDSSLADIERLAADRHNLAGAATEQGRATHAHNTHASHPAKPEHIGGILENARSSNRVEPVHSTSLQTLSGPQERAIKVASHSASKDISDPEAKDKKVSSTSSLSASSGAVAASSQASNEPNHVSNDPNSNNQAANSLNLLNQAQLIPPTNNAPKQSLSTMTNSQNSQNLPSPSGFLRSSSAPTQSIQSTTATSILRGSADGATLTPSQAETTVDQNTVNSSATIAATISVGGLSTGESNANTVIEPSSMTNTVGTDSSNMTPAQQIVSENQTESNLRTSEEEQLQADINASAQEQNSATAVNDDASPGSLYNAANPIGAFDGTTSAPLAGAADIDTAAPSISSRAPTDTPAMPQGGGDVVSSNPAAGFNQGPDALSASQAASNALQSDLSKGAEVTMPDGTVANNPSPSSNNAQQNPTSNFGNPAGSDSPVESGVGNGAVLSGFEPGAGVPSTAGLTGNSSSVDAATSGNKSTTATGFELGSVGQDNSTSSVPAGAGTPEPSGLSPFEPVGAGTPEPSGLSPFGPVGIGSSSTAESPAAGTINSSTTQSGGMETSTQTGSGSFDGTVRGLANSSGVVEDTNISDSSAISLLYSTIGPEQSADSASIASLRAAAANQNSQETRTEVIDQVQQTAEPSLLVTAMHELDLQNIAIPVSVDLIDKVQEFIEPLMKKNQQDLSKNDFLNPEPDLMQRLSAQINNWFIDPNGEQFQVNSTRNDNGNSAHDENVNTVAMQFLNTNGELVNAQMDGPISKFLLYTQFGGEDRGEGCFDIMDAIQQADRSSNAPPWQNDPKQPLNNDPFNSSNNDPSYSQFDPNYPGYQCTRDPSSFVDYLIEGSKATSDWFSVGADGYNPLDAIFQHDQLNSHYHNQHNSNHHHDPYASKLEQEISASIDPVRHHWIDPLIDHQYADYTLSHAQDDRYHKQDDWLQQQKEKEKEEHERRERGDKEREAKAKAEAEAKEYAAAMMLALKQAAQRENAERQLQQEHLLQREMRKKYIVLPGDTLESISQKMLFNKGLAPLIYEINRSLIPVALAEGKRLLQLKPRTIIFLPTAFEIKRYNKRLFGKNQQFEYEQQVAPSGEGTKNGFSLVSMLGNIGARSSGLSQRSDDFVVNQVERRRANIQNVLGKLQESSQLEDNNSGRIVYSCRLGDTLRSIALRHPSLQDVSLWKLIAQINNLSTELDEKGSPLAPLSRNTKIKLPSAQEVHDFKTRVRKRITPVPIPQTGESVLPVKLDAGMNESVLPVKHDAGMNESVLPVKLDASMNESISSAKLDARMNETILPVKRDACTNEIISSVKHDAYMNEIILPDEEYVPELDHLLRALGVHIRTEESDKQITMLAERCRTSRSGDLRGSAVPFVLSLEIRQNNGWTAIISYEINEEQSWRFEVAPGSSRRAKQISLPIRLAKQMAENDITKNWRQYAKVHNVYS